MEIWQILTIVFGILAAFFGVYWVKAKNIITEVSILFGLISEALKDDTLTKEELELIVAQIKKIIGSFKVETIRQAVTTLKMMKTRK
jgi:hypothetical protein